MKAKFLTLVFVTLILIGSSYAIDDGDILDNVLARWEFEAGDINVDGVGGYNWTIFSYDSNVTGKIGNAAYFLDNEGYQSGDAVFDRLKDSLDFSINLWAKPEAFASNDIVSSVGQWDAGGGANTRWILNHNFNNDATGDVGLYWCDAWTGSIANTGYTDWSMFTITWNEAANNLSVYFNGTIAFSTTARTCGSDDNEELAGVVQTYNTVNGDISIDEMTYHNVTLSGDEVSHLFNSGAGRNLTRPQAVPEISNLNCTSCNPPVGDTVSPYTTTDTTPTFIFDTDVNSNCRIADEDLNHTGMGSSRNCTSGAGTKDHTCTLTVQDELVFPTDYVYIGCENSDNNAQGINSTSGALEMQLTDLINTSINAIDDGIQASAIWPGATVYNNQQVYLRDLSDNQLLTTVDRVAVSGNQRWLLNYENTTKIGLFNITPAVYVLDMINMSPYDIRISIETLINNTKT